MIHPPGVLQCLADTKSAVCTAHTPHVLAALIQRSFFFTFRCSMAIQPTYL